MPAGADSVRLKGDTLIAISDNDSVQINTKDLTRAISGAISDTITPTEQDDEVDYAYQSQQAANNLAEAKATQRTVVTIVAIVGNVILLLVLLALFFWFLHRRAKYRMMEKAIENNYPLYQVQQPVEQQPQPQYYQPQPEQPQAQPQQQQPQSQPQQPQPVFGSLDGINWNTKQFRHAYTLLAVGIGLVLFFLLNDVPAMAGLMLMFVLLGLGKGFLAYQDQRSYQQVWKQNAWRQQAQQQAQQPPKFDHPEDQQPQA